MCSVQHCLINLADWTLGNRNSRCTQATSITHISHKLQTIAITYFYMVESSSKENSLSVGSVSCLCQWEQKEYDPDADTSNRTGWVQKYLLKYKNTMTYGRWLGANRGHQHTFNYASETSWSRETFFLSWKRFFFFCSDHRKPNSLYWSGGRNHSDEHPLNTHSI